jgi:hypothetical protein
MGVQMDWMSTLKSLAPTVASAFLGPLGGVAVAAVGNLLGVSEATQDKIADVIKLGNLTPEQIGEIKKLELEYQENEKERNFKYSELEFKDTASAREMQVATKSMTPSILTWIVVGITLACEGMLLFNQVPSGADPIIIGRVLGTMDSALIMVLGFWFGSSHGSQNKDAIIASQK